ncbi:MAG: hypothetical protein BV458_09915 [Thermoplasmata archaeon M9B2D]|nr:MAG: hypothetical protein BV458_09915 [Thermoplasmata archaeon M9B2D]
MKPRVEQLREWFDDPVTELLNFLSSGQAIMSIVFNEGKRKRVVELSQRDVAQLLDELGAKREDN